MSRKRDTNWTRDEITVLLDSIMEITKMRAVDGRRTNSREVFEYAAKKLGEKGHAARAEREKCRTKWKKMKEEFSHARKARETGEGRVAPGIEPFYTRMLEFVNGNFQNISPHSTIVRRSSSISSNMNNISYSSSNNLSHNGNSHNSSSNTDESSILPSSAATTPNIGSESAGRSTQSGPRTSARIAAATNGIVSNDTSDTSSTILTRQAKCGGFSPVNPTSTDSSLLPRQHSQPSTMNSTNDAGAGADNGMHTSATSLQNESTSVNNNQQPHRQQDTTPQSHQNDSHRLIPNGYASNSHGSSNKHNSETNDSNNSLAYNESSSHNHRDTDISYRVSSGFRQITIFGHHDVDIKFRENCVTINKISPDYASPSTGGHNSDS